MLVQLKKKLIHWLARNLLPLIEEKDLLAFNKKNQGFINGEPLTEAEITVLKQEVIFIRQTRVWELINSYFTILACKKLYKEGEGEIDILFAKVMLYTLDVQKQIIEKIGIIKS